MTGSLSNAAAKMHVIVLNDYCYVNGGASKIAIDEAISLAEAGLRVTFLGATGPVDESLRQAPLEVICLQQPELIDAGKSPAVLFQGLWNREAERRMAVLLQPLDPRHTIVHLHGYTKSLTTSPVRAAVKAGFPVICTLHDFFAACPNGAFFHYPDGVPCGRRALSPDCLTTNCDKRAYAHKLYRVGRSLVQRGPGMLPRGVKHYITLSERSAGILRSYLPEDAHYYPLENLIEVTQRSPVAVAEHKTLVAVGRLDVEKGIEPLLAAVRQSGAKLTLIGDGPLRAQAEVAGCRVTGWLAGDQVQAALDEARFLVFPSLWYETYGLVVAEAAARGIPAIVSDVSAASERVEDGVTGWHVRAGDVADLTAALARTQDDAAVRRMGQEAYARFWRNPPTRENHTAGLIAIYDRLLAGLNPLAKASA